MEELWIHFQKTKKQMTKDHITYVTVMVARGCGEGQMNGKITEDFIAETIVYDASGKCVSLLCPNFLNMQHQEGAHR